VRFIVIMQSLDHSYQVYPIWLLSIIFLNKKKGNVSDAQESIFGLVMKYLPVLITVWSRVLQRRKAFFLIGTFVVGLACNLLLFDYLADGVPVGVFPEGTISKTGELMPLKTGFFKLAMETGVPIVPIGMWGNQDACCR
jgi:1-acyl-sn-glycerol-3-phosphate acyltransferase